MAMRDFCIWYYVRMKNLFIGILLIVVIGVGGLVYRNAVEHPSRPIACPLDAKVCPDGSLVARVGESCVFQECPLPNVSLSDVGIAFAVPAGFAQTALVADAEIVVYSAEPTASSTASIRIRRYALAASSTVSDIIAQTAIDGASGMPVAATALTSAELGGRRYTVASIERFEGVVDTAYYLARGADVLRFDAVDTGVSGWAEPNLNVPALPAHAALLMLLSNLQML